jgi:hypothetical protein
VPRLEISQAGNVGKIVVEGDKVVAVGVGA